MSDRLPNVGSGTLQKRETRTKDRKARRRRTRIFVWVLVGITAACLAWMAWLASTALHIKSEFDAAADLVPALKVDVASTEQGNAAMTVERIRHHTFTAKEAVDQPLWVLATSIPLIGANFGAVAEVARSADDVAGLGLEPLVKVYGSLDWDSLLPSSSGTNLEPLKAASPSVSSAAQAVRLSAERLNQIDESKLLTQVADPLNQARKQLQDVTGALDTAAKASQIVPGMLGADAPRHYLLMIQNNAEVRASGGIPGALAVLTLENGKLTLGTQSSATDLGTMVPTLPVEAEQQQIYSGRLGKFMQDVNLTPDFPTSAATSQAMWERKTGQRVDGVISIDPVALGYILDATGPVELTNRELVTLTSGRLPIELNGKNVVPTLLSDVYAKIEQPKLQDAYFAGVAQEIFAALSDGKGNAKGLIEGITRGADEGRVLVWSGLPAEQSIIAKYPLSGSIAGPSVAPAQ